MKRILFVALGMLVVVDNSFAQRPGSGGRGPGQGGQGGRGGGRPGGGGFGGLENLFGGGGNREEMRRRFEGMMQGRGGEDMRRRFEQMRRGGGGGGENAIREMMLEGARRSGVTLNEQPTLRMSLFETVQRIGLENPGAQGRAEQVLKGQLGVTHRGAEVIFLDKLLTEMAEDKYVDSVIDAAKYLLKQEPSEGGEDLTMRSDRGSREQLWSLLRKYKDETFVKDAQKMLLTKREVPDRENEGQVKAVFELNRGARDYLRNVLGGNVVDPFAEIYQTPNLSDQIKRDLWSVINDHIDTNAVAGQVMVLHYNGLMKNVAKQEADRQARAAAAQNGGEGGRRSGGSTRGGDWRNRGSGGGSRDDAKGELMRLVNRPRGGEVSSEAIISRKTILGNMRQVTSDPDFITMIDQVDKRLTEMANPPAPTEGKEGEGRQRGRGSSFRLEDPREARQRAERDANRSPEERKRIEDLRKRFEERRNKSKKDG